MAKEKATQSGSTTPLFKTALEVYNEEMAAEQQMVKQEKNKQRKAGLNGCCEEIYVKRGIVFLERLPQPRCDRCGVTIPPEDRIYLYLMGHNTARGCTQSPIKAICWCHKCVGADIQARRDAWGKPKPK